MVYYLLQTENTITTDHHEDFSNNVIFEEIESSIENNNDSYISKKIIHEDVERTISIAPIAPIPETTISVPSTVNIEKILKEAEQAKLEVKKTKLKLQQADVLVSKLIRSKTILIKRVKRLMHENKKLNIENRNLKQKNFKKILNEDQIKALNRQSVKGCKWSDNTIKKALRLKLSCGSSGYQELLSQGIPLPNERTLRRRLENIDFKPGICEPIFDVLKQRISEFTDDREKDCMLVLDEMSIMPGEQIDQSTMSHIGLSTLPDRFGKQLFICM